MDAASGLHEDISVVDAAIVDAPKIAPSDFSIYATIYHTWYLLSQLEWQRQVRRG